MSGLHAMIRSSPRRSWRRLKWRNHGCELVRGQTCRARAAICRRDAGVWRIASGPMMCRERRCTRSSWCRSKYLGLTIDNRLTFSRHIDLLVGKIASKLKTFQWVRNSLDNRARRSFYISLIQTSLLYGSNAFSPFLSITHVNRLI